MKIALYARVSTADKGQDPEMQLRELREYCERRGWIVATEHVDVGVSGAKDSRPQLNKLMADAKQRRFDAILVWKLDRFGRSLKHLVSALGEFEALGIAFVSLRDSFDLTTPAGRLMFNMVASSQSSNAISFESGLRRASPTVAPRAFGWVANPLLWTPPASGP